MASFDIINANRINTQKSLWNIEDIYRLPYGGSQTNSDSSGNNIGLTENTYIGSSYLFGSNYTGPGGVEKNDQFNANTGKFTANLSGTYVVTYNFKLNKIGFLYFVAKDSNGNRLSSSHKLAYYNPPHETMIEKNTIHVSGGTTLYLEKGGTFGFECMDDYSTITIGDRYTTGPNDTTGSNDKISYSGITVLRL